MSHRTLGLLVGDRPSEEMRAAVHALGTRCRVVAWGPELKADALFVFRSAMEPPPDTPSALWVETAADIRSRHADGATVLLSAWRAFADEPRMVVVPSSDVGEDATPLTPFSRARLRRARDLPGHVVAFGGTDGWCWGESPPAPVDAELAQTVAALASVVVATGENTVLALAWAAPTVTDRATATDLRLTDGTNALVGDSGAERKELAHRLIDDDVLAARLAWNGRQHFERQLSRAAVIDAVLGLLDLRSEPADAVARVQGHLDALHTPASALIRRRATSAMLALQPSPHDSRSQ